jgi:hypothetical protein
MCLGGSVLSTSSSIPTNLEQRAVVRPVADGTGERYKQQCCQHVGPAATYNNIYRETLFYSVSSLRATEGPH